MVSGMPVECKYDSVVVAGKRGNLCGKRFRSAHVERAPWVEEVTLNIHNYQGFKIVGLHGLRR